MFSLFPLLASLLLGLTQLVIASDEFLISYYVVKYGTQYGGQAQGSVPYDVYTFFNVTDASADITDRGDITWCAGTFNHTEPPSETSPILCNDGGWSWYYKSFRNELLFSLHISRTVGGTTLEGSTGTLNWMEMNDEKRGTYTYTYQGDTWVFFDNRTAPVVAA